MGRWAKRGVYEGSDMPEFSAFRRPLAVLVLCVMSVFASALPASAHAHHGAYRASHAHYAYRTMRRHYVRHSYGAEPRYAHNEYFTPFGQSSEAAPRSRAH